MLSAAAVLLARELRASISAADVIDDFPESNPLICGGVALRVANIGGAARSVGRRPNGKVSGNCEELYVGAELGRG